MRITVELFDIPRRRAGTGRVVIEIDADGVSLSDVLSILSERFPALAATCFDGPRLRTGYLANVGGRHFLIDPDARLREGDELFVEPFDIFLTVIVGHC